MSSERYYQEPETVVSNSDKQYGTIDKNSLENIKPVTNSLKDSNTRHLLESKLQQGLEDLNLINEKVKLKKHNSLRLLKQQQKPNLSIHPNTNIAASEVVHLQKQYPQHQKSVSNSNSLSPLHTQNSSNSKSSPNFNNFSTISANTSTENTPQNYPKQINSDSLSMSRIDSGHQSVSLNSPENVNLDQSPDTVTVMSHLSRSRPGTINLQNDSSPERQQQYASMAYKNQSFSAHGSPYNFTAAPSNNPLIVPINDLRITECESEKMHEHRCKLASLYRLVHLYKWDHEIFNHISYRIGEHEYLINPFGLLYYEITASKLLLINSQTGKIVNSGSTNGEFGFNQAGFNIHSAIHLSRPEITTVIHVHTPEVITCSLSPNFSKYMFSQEGCILGPIATHKYNGIVVDKNEQKMLRKSLGKKAKILMLANHGACVLGETVEEAWHYLYNLMYYCKTFMSVMSCNLHQNEKAVPEKFKKKTYEIVTGGDTSSKGKNPVGKMLFEANMRRLDNLGYRTGYRYANGYNNYKLEVESHLHNASRFEGA